jgi:hypothetical protein
MDSYDIIVVGAGPAGLALAHYASRANKKILILEKENTLGGCHRVNRTSGMFSEHGPRVYSSNYHNFKDILKNIGSSFDDMFTPYNFSLSTIGGYSVSKMKVKEIMLFSVEYLKLLLFPSHGKDTTVLQFCIENNFSVETIEYLDAVCRLTDGATADKYTLFQLLNTIDQHAFYNFYQPKVPTDIGLFKLWGDYLKNRNVTIKLNQDVKLNIKNGKVLNINDQYNAKDYILAVPPESLVRLLGASNIPDSFGKNLKQYAKDTEYIDYKSITFHFNRKIDIPKVWGIPKNDWGVGFIITTDYTDLNEKESQTLISAVITKTDTKSKLTGKTSKESSRMELVLETWRQLQLNLPKPFKAIIYPIQEEAYVANIHSSKYTIPFQSKDITNLYSLGTHNKKSFYNFTSLESAVTNSKFLSNKLYGTRRSKDRLVSLSFVIKCILALLVIYYVIQ